MTTHHDGEPFWQVQAVQGCDIHGGFAYTTGLATRGLNELHMWDRPTHGDDPGADFSLSSEDLCELLDGFAAEWVADSVRIGDIREVSLDDGLTTAIVTFGEPVGAADVEAWGACGSKVVPLVWSLHRPPRGAPVEIMTDARESYEREVRIVAERCDPRVAVSGARSPGDVVDFAVDGPYGPLSTLVEVNARAMAGADRLDVLIGNAISARWVVSPGALMGRMATLSRLSGRDEQLEQVHLLGHRVVDRLAKRRAWRNQVAAVAKMSGAATRHVGPALKETVGATMLCALMGLALDDVLPDDMVLASQGPWRATLSRTGGRSRTTVALFGACRAGHPTGVCVIRAVRATSHRSIDDRAGGRAAR